MEKVQTNWKKKKKTFLNNPSKITLHKMSEKVSLLSDIMTIMCHIITLAFALYKKMLYRHNF